MKFCHIFTLVLLVSVLQAEPISEEEKKRLLKQVEQALNDSENAIKKRNLNIHKLLKRAANSKQECTSLYYDAVKEIHFTSQGRSNSDFVAWKKTNRDRLSKKAHQQWLQAQVKWLHFAVESKNLGSDEFKKSFIIALNKYLEEFYSDLEKLSKEGKESGLNLHNEFKKNIMQSEISKYLEIQHAANNQWPHNPAKVKDIYNNYIFPFIRDLKDKKLLKSAWEKRISHEAKLIQALHGLEKKGLRDAKAGIEIRQFNTKVKPKLIWQMHMDLFKHGDERSSASKMLSHIKQHRSHPDSPTWAKQLMTLLAPKPSEKNSEQQ